MNRRLVVLVVALAVATTGILVLVATLPGSSGGLTAFHDYSELVSYLDRTYGRGGWLSGSNATFAGTPVAAPAPGSGAAGSPAYSGTNVQVAGVDELDTVKSDGTYLYLAGQRDVAIIQPVPANDMRVLARVPAAVGVPEDNWSSPYTTGMFVVDTHLVVVGQDWGRYPVPMGGPTPAPAPGGGVVVSAMMPWGLYGGHTYVAVYDLTDPSHPRLADNYTIAGTPVTGRLISPYVYLVISQPILRINDTYELPSVCDGAACAPLPAGEIYYDPTSQEASTFTNVFAANADTGAVAVSSIVTGGTSTIYMSPNALYLTFTKWSGGPVMGAPVGTPTTTVQAPSGEWTTIQKVEVSGLALNPVAHGDVPGWILNQYSMDEHEGYLRVFTHEVNWTNMSVTQTNSLYILDPSMVQAGSLVGLGAGENLRAARFLGDRAYLVTFRNIDPLFVIDVSNPTAPRLLGELQIPGYSDYLYPVDATHLLGIGKNAVNASEGNFAWYQGLKIALFDVSDVSNPVEMSNYSIGDRGTTSDVLYDPKAFLPIPSLGLVVLPVTLAVINTTQWGNPPPDYAYGEPVWQGVYVLHVDTTGGISLFGRVSHENGTADPSAGVYLDWNRMIDRSLYIGDILYTVSPAMLQANALSDLSLVGSLQYEP